MLQKYLLFLCIVSGWTCHGQGFKYPFQNYELPVDQRVENLLSLMTQEEKIYQTWSMSPAIPRFGIKAYNWRSNCLHGWSSSVGTWGNLTWTVFPEPIGLGATFNSDLIRLVGIATADEGRALHNIGIAERNGDSWEAQGINCFAPNVNLLRDPRWGRGQETFGEDPHLISRMGVAYTRGLQEGDDPNYIKIAACGKHYALHSGPESERFYFTVNVTLHDIFDTYMPAMEAVIKEGKIATMMPAYSGVRVTDAHVPTNGAPDPANVYVLKEVAREMYGFKGVHISDNRAVEFVWNPHNYTQTKEECAAVCINATCDMDLGYDAIYPDYLGKAISQGMVQEKTLDESVRRIMKLRFQLGDFDPLWKVPYQWLGEGVLNSPGNQMLNLRSALESIVLLRNEKNVLPLKKNIRVSVIGPNANDTDVLLGNYPGVPAQIITPLQGIISKLGSSNVHFASGCQDIFCNTSSQFSQAVSAAKNSEVAILFLGISDDIEDEGLDRVYSYPCDGVPTVPKLTLPGCQERLLDEISKLGIPTIVVLLNGAGISGKWQVDGTVPAILEAFYPGALGGQAIADVLFGDYTPGGKMPYTVFNGEEDLPNFTSYEMDLHPGRTYRYYRGSKVLFPFGYGLSYTRFQFSSVTASRLVVEPCVQVEFKLNVSNVGRVEGDVVVQLYVVVPRQMGFPVPRIQLEGFKRIPTFPGEDVQAVDRQRKRREMDL
eukprot:TRINITY_DN632_c2_g1_i3.p1 TRINITY_DN632_c2_g1~~TRINITY_DN632_c2_g1_i3.p1  ORF type:complete len:715 (+),score=224.85 TRINITY_DN632_c2_g1_i3:27-2171(+)